ncbi:ATP-binding protein [Glycomyces paridis]|uniref:IstB-like ATP-binding domain-containing protein n=1 Tax=Glycomyces paridis TaxID=2126555 RepID=A0A4S8PF29_9ACTN|nr:ATP-binding protein [Glycomyces paridis]THV27922.1 hypothetical protein E9998_13095 [Glycomyces paridis]
MTANIALPARREQARCPEHPDQPIAHCGPCRSELIGRTNLDREHGMTDAADPDAAHNNLTRRRQIARNRWEALVDDEFATASLADFADVPREALAVVAVWNRGGDVVPWLRISGLTGTGKTHLMYAIGRAVVTGQRPVGEWIATTAPAMYAAMRPSAENPALARYRLQTTPLLLLDDVGVNKHTEWIEEVTHDVLDERYRRHLPVLMTTNLETADLKAAIGDRMTSRLRQRCLSIVLEGPDRRRPPTLEGLGLAALDLTVGAA